MAAALDVHVLTGGGVDAHAGAAFASLAALALGIGRRSHLVAISADAHLALGGLVLGSLILQRAARGHADRRAGDAGAHRDAALALRLGAAASGADIDAQVGGAQLAGLARRAGYVALGHAAAGLDDGAGDAAVVDVDADIRAPMTGGLLRGLLIDGSLVMDIAGGDAHRAARLNLRALILQLAHAVAGDDVQLAAHFHFADLGRAAVAHRAAAVLAELQPGAGLVQASGQIQSAAGDGAGLIAMAAVLRRGQADVLAGQAGVAAIGLKLGAVDRQIVARRQLDAAAGQQRAGLVGLVQQLAAGGVLDAHAAAVLLVAGFGADAAQRQLGVLRLIASLHRLAGYLDVAHRLDVQRLGGLDQAAGHRHVAGGDQLQVGVGLQRRGHRVLLAGAALAGAAGDVERGAGALVGAGLAQIQRAVDDDAAGLGLGVRALRALRLAAVDGDAGVAVDEQLAAGADRAAGVDGGAAAVVLVAAAADAAPIGLAVLRAAAVGAGLHGQLDLGLRRQDGVAAGLQRGGLRVDVAAGRHAQRVAGAQLRLHQPLLAAAVVPTAGFQRGAVVLAVADIAAGVGFGQRRQLDPARRRQLDVVAGLHAGAGDGDIGAGRGDFHVMAGLDASHRLLLAGAALVLIEGPGILPGMIAALGAAFGQLAIQIDAGAGQLHVLALDVGRADMGVAAGVYLDGVALQRRALDAGVGLAGRAVALAGLPDEPAFVVLAVLAGFAVHAAGNIHAGAVQRQLLALQLGGLHRQRAGRADRQLVAAGQIAAHIDAGAGVGADDIDAARLHRAQEIAVQLAHAFRRFGGGCHLAAGVVDGIEAGADADGVGRGDAAADIQPRRDQIQHIDAGRAGPGEAEGVAVIGRLQRGDGAVLQIGGADQQRSPRDIDEAAAVARDAVGVGQHVVGGLAEYLLPAQQQGRIAADHLVQDHAGLIAAQQRVAGKLAGELGVAALQRVVEYRAGLADVEVLILVVRHAGRSGRDDIDHLRAIGGGADLRLAGAARHDAGGHAVVGKHESQGQRGCDPAGRGQIKLYFFHHHPLDTKTRNGPA
ncbi:hypothetical protein ABI908_05680 [Chromobacterium phragmitis]|uniref:Uncharacterized protein n=1 Tax=Chromobacterium phragmitis TaxID=2202141 RepID=A0ABV0ISE7_9NEIS